MSIHFFTAQTLNELYPGKRWRISTSEGEINLSNIIKEDEFDIDEDLVNEKIQELQAAEPLRLLRIERTRLLNETDWEVTRGIEEGIDITELKAYRSDLRNLPQEIEAGNIEAPILNENGQLVFNSWPVRE